MKPNLLRCSLIAVLLLLTTAARAQTGTIRGFVYDKATGEPVIFTNVILKGTTTGAATDVNGYYSISKIAPGTYTLMVTYLGYDTLTKVVRGRRAAKVWRNGWSEILCRNSPILFSLVQMKG